MERYTQEEHFERLIVTTEVVRKQLGHSPCLRRFRRYLNHEPVWLSRVENRGSRYLRPLVVRNVMETVTGDADAWARFPGLLAAAELFNISTYQGDGALEDEGAIGNELPAEDAFLRVGLPLSLSMIALSCAYNLVAEIPADRGTRELLCRTLISTMERVYRGQLQDGVDLRRSPSFDPMALSEPEFRRRYLIRCLNLDGFQLAMCVLFGLAPGGLARPGGIPPWARQLLRVGIEFGVCLQILNDLEDFVTRDTNLALRDLKTGRVTYFAYALWHHSPEARSGVTMVTCHGSGEQGDAERSHQGMTIIAKHSGFLRDLGCQLLAGRYRKLRMALVQARPFLADRGRVLDFVFPHIFLSRILRD